MITKYNKYNESIKSLLVGPTEEEIIDNISKLSPNDMFKTSIKCNMLEGVKKSIELGADVLNFYNGNYGLSLQSISYNCNLEIFEYLINNKIIDLKEKIYIQMRRQTIEYTLMCDLIYYNKIDIIRFLLNTCDIDINSSNYFSIAVDNNQYEIINLFLDYDFSRDDISNGLLKSIKFSRYKIVELILDKTDIEVSLEMMDLSDSIFYREGPKPQGSEKVHNLIVNSVYKRK